MLYSVEVLKPDGRTEILAEGVPLSRAENVRSAYAPKSREYVVVLPAGLASLPVSSVARVTMSRRTARRLNRKAFVR